MGFAVLNPSYEPALDLADSIKTMPSNQQEEHP